MIKENITDHWRWNTNFDILRGHNALYAIRCVEKPRAALPRILYSCSWQNRINFLVGYSISKMPIQYMKQAKHPLFLHNSLRELLNIYGRLKYTNTFQLDPTHRWLYICSRAPYITNPPSAMMRAHLNISHLINLFLNRNKWYRKIRCKHALLRSLIGFRPFFHQMVFSSLSNWYVH